MVSSKEIVSALPDLCGVYLIKDSTGNIIYIGKSNSIKKRISTHFRTKLADKIASVDYILTESELSALILEASLIKKYKPKYNVSMRDDKQYPFVMLTMSEDFPMLTISRKVDDEKSVYFGPYKSLTARMLIKVVSKIFGLRSCANFKKRAQPCLNYYIKRCSAPCIDNISKKEYWINVKKAIDFLSHGPEQLLKELKSEMDKASRNMDFERAAKLRDNIHSIEKMISRFENRYTKQKRKDLESLNELQKIFSLKKTPKRIEAIDISNIGKDNTVGSLVVFLDGAPYKNNYRRFKIRTAKLPNDVAAIYEVVTRRYSGSLKDKFPFPDILLIDGGTAQLNSAMQALNNLGANLPFVISLAKENEEIYLPGTKTPLVLPKDSNALNLLRAIRDEAHRFAVSYHRKLRHKEMF